MVPLEGLRAKRGPFCVTRSYPAALTLDRFLHVNDLATCGMRLARKFDKAATRIEQLVRGKLRVEIQSQLVDAEGARDGLGPLQQHTADALAVPLRPDRDIFDQKMRRLE